MILRSSIKLLERMVFTGLVKVNSKAVIHVYDEASGFHMARQLDGYNTDHIIPGFRDMWLSWAGPPGSMYLDPAGEFHSYQ